MNFADTLVTIAKTELETWEGGSWTECVRKGKDPSPDKKKQPGSIRVAQYWKEGVGVTDRNGCSEYAWSAAFICWCLRQAGLKLDQFPFSGAHHKYIRWAINNQKQNKPGKTLYGQRLTYAPKPGDLIAQWRKEKKTDPDPNISYNHQPDDFYISHCDIVVATRPDEITTIGGNLSNKVRTTRFDAVGGVLAPKKELICVLECRV